MNKRLKNILVITGIVLFALATSIIILFSVFGKRKQEKETQKELEKHTCVWDEGTVKTPPDCIEEGIMLYTCKCGETKEEKIPALGHKMDKIAAVLPTKKTNGVREHYVCENCGKLFVNEMRVEAGSEFTSAAYPFGNFSGTSYYIKELESNKVAVLEATAYWPVDLAISKEYNVADVPAGEYVMSFDVLLDSDVHADQWSLVVAMVSDGAYGSVDILNTKPDANSLGYNMLTNANSKTWTTFEIPFATIGEYDMLKSVVYLWPEKYLNESIYLDNFKIYKKGDVSKTNIDTLSGDFEDVETYIQVKEADLVTTWNDIYENKNANLSAHKHVWDKGKIEKKAECTTNGIKMYTCECGETKSETIPAIKHNMKKVSEVAPTTEKDGVREHYICKNCNKMFVNEAYYVEAGSSFSTIAYPFGNFSTTGYYIQRLGNNKVAKLESTAYWPADLAISKEYKVADVPAGEYVMSFDVLLGSGVHADQWSLVVAMVSDGAYGSVDILNTKPDANSLGYKMLTNANSKTWTTYEIPFTTTGEYGMLKSVIYLWPETYLNEPVYLDNFKIYKKGDTSKTNIDTLAGDFEGVDTYLEVTKDDIKIPYIKHEHVWDNGVVKTSPSCTEEGTMLYSCKCGETRTEVIVATGHSMKKVDASTPKEEQDGNIEHYVCEKCEKIFVDKEFYVEAGTGFSTIAYPFGNFSGTTYCIENYKNNKVAKLEAIAYWPTDLAISKEYNVADIPAGKYVMSFDVLLGSDVHADQWSLVVAMASDGEYGSVDILNTKPDANSLGYNMLTNANSETWTTFEIPFTTYGEYSSLKSVIYLWPEAYLNEPIYLDNFKIYKQGDVAKQNIDTLTGDFENIINYCEVEKDEVIIHSYDEGIVTKKPTCNEEGTIKYTCSVCGKILEKKIVYDENKVVTLTKNAVVGPYANYSDNDFRIQVINGNAVGNLTVGVGWPSTTSFTKEVGVENISPGKYVLSFDVLLGADEIVDGYSMIAAMNLDGNSTDILNTKPNENNLGLDMLHNANHETWTTYEVEFDISEHVDTLSFTFYLWSEVRNGGSIFIDNLEIYAKDDVEKVNKDTMLGDFEGYAAFKEIEE